MCTLLMLCLYLFLNVDCSDHVVHVQLAIYKSGGPRSILIISECVLFVNKGVAECTMAGVHLAPSVQCEYTVSCSCACCKSLYSDKPCEIFQTDQ